MQESFDNELQQEYERFIEFGDLLDRKMRKYLVQYLRDKLEPGSFDVPELNDQYFIYFQRSLDDIFNIEQLIPLLKENPRITRRVVLDTLQWLRKTYRQVSTQNPFQDELQRLEGWAVTPLHVFLKRWPFIIQFLGATYTREELDIRFYQDRFARLIQDRELKDIPAGDRKKLELILTDLLAQWDALLQSKILDYQLRKLEEEREQYTDFLEAKVQEYNQLKSLVSPFSEYLGWDMSRQLWEETSFDIIDQYDELLKDEDSIRELADLLGRMRESEVEMEEETYEKTIIRQEWVVDEHSRSEIAGVHESDDLNQLLSSEAGLLGDELTELLFLKKYADRSLITFRYEDRRLMRSEDQTTEVYQRTRQKEKGPFIVCVDTSESMTGRPEQIAKVLCMGVLKMAIRENRRAYLINFSLGIKTLDLYEVTDSIDELARFLRMSFYGGTDVTPALHETIRQLQTHDYQDADVLVVSDFIMPKINRDVLRDLRYFQQNKGTQVHSLTLSDDPNTQVLETFDTNWVYDPDKKGVIRELTQGLETIRQRY